MKTLALAAFALSLAASNAFAFNPQPDPPHSAQQGSASNPWQQNGNLPGRSGPGQ
jgi:hypothetical protein